MGFRRGRRALVLSIVVGLAVVVLLLGAGWDIVLERWHLCELGSVDDDDAKIEAIERLGVVGSHRSIEPLIAAGEDPPLVSAVMAALCRIYRRLARKERAEVIRAFAKHVDSGETASGEIVAARTIVEHVRRWCAEIPTTREILAEVFPHAARDGRLLVSYALLDAWPGSKNEIADLCARSIAASRPRDVVEFFRLGLLGYYRTTAFAEFLEEFLGDPGFGEFTRDRPGQVARHFALAHDDPRVRAISLTVPGPNDTFSSDKALERIEKAFDGDEHPLVRKVALRLAAWRGRGSASLLSRVLRSSRDPEFLIEAIEGLSLRSVNSWMLEGFELWDGLVCDWIYREKNPVPHWLGDAELDRIEEILAESSHPDLRDAASMALANRYRDISLAEHLWPEKAGRRRPLQVPGLRVHEWGVLCAGGASLAMRPRRTEDSPDFLHRTATSAADLWARVDPSFADAASFRKPVVYFYSDEPLSIYLRIDFRSGRPWSFYPDSTDYHVRRVTMGGTTVAGSGGFWAALTSVGAAGVESLERKEVRPLWVEPGLTQTSSRAPQPTRTSNQFDMWDEDPEPPRPSEAELRSRYGIAPWLVPNHPTLPKGKAARPTGFGVEWRGLRIGYEESLEGALREVDGDHWWSRLREVPSSTVAVRGEREKFVFYDGAAGLPSPLIVRWKDRARRELVLSLRNLESYPGFDDEHDHRAKRMLPPMFIVDKQSGAPVRGAFRPPVATDRRSMLLTLDELPLGLEGEALRGRLRNILEERGLTTPEASGLLSAWASEFFEQDGVRVIAVLPRWLYDGLLPMVIWPRPGELVRVGLIYHEL